VKKRAAERGYQWYALLMPFEIEEAQKRLSGKWTKMGMVGPIKPLADRNEFVITPISEINEVNLTYSLNII
jgi:hypothetical protein